MVEVDLRRLWLLLGGAGENRIAQATGRDAVDRWQRIRQNRRRVVVRVAAEQHVVAIESMIDSDVEAVVVLRFGRAVGEVVRERVVRGNRKQIRQRDSRAIHPAGGDLIVRERCARQRIENRRQTGKITPPHAESRNRRGVGVTLPQPQSGIVDEEERFVGDESAAKTSAELVQLELRLRSAGGKEIARIERFVAVELEGRPVQLVRAALGHDVDHSARGPTQLR